MDTENSRGAFSTASVDNARVNLGVLAKDKLDSCSDEELYQLAREGKGGHTEEGIRKINKQFINQSAHQGIKKKPNHTVRCWTSRVAPRSFLQRGNPAEVSRVAS